MGMVGSEDIIFAISWSGETSELNDIVHFSKQNNIKLISLTSSSESHLASSADISLILPKATEACPNGLAPTTSTTMQLIVGDAIAICLLNERGFDKDKFKSLHPGGQLGAALSTLEDIMHKEDTIPLLNSGTNMSEALIKISEKGFGCSGVTKNDELIGIVTDGDLRRHMGPGLLEKTVDEIMNTNPKTVSRNMLATDALDLINEIGIQGLFIVDEKKHPLGFIHFHDLIRLIKQ
jgi:arabinose-5-phosphate isomerase